VAELISDIFLFKIVNFVGMSILHYSMIWCGWKLFVFVILMKLLIMTITV